MNEIIGITCALIGGAYLFWGVSVGKVPFTVENATFWGIGLGITAVGLIFLIANRMDTPSYWDGPDILRLTSRPIPA